jgi:hypothetical protein
MQAPARANLLRISVMLLDFCRHISGQAGLLDFSHLTEEKRDGLAKENDGGSLGCG